MEYSGLWNILNYGDLLHQKYISIMERREDDMENGYGYYGHMERIVIL